MLCLYFILFYLFLSVRSIRNFVPYNEQKPDFQVNIADGKIQGYMEYTEDGFKFYSFMGIPFAQPPLEKLRFRPPKAHPKWFGVLDARTPANCCTGLNIRELTKLKFVTEGEEDCLYLNVYTPVLPNAKTRFSQLLKPVLVWVHGGSYLAGCNDRTHFGPEFLVVHDVILVTVNYRLSIFGFLSTGDKDCPGNWGLLDQILALKWIQQNIRAFGGDPGKVTVYGQSSGAASVNLLMITPKAKGLLHGVIMSSGSALCPWSIKIDFSKVAEDLAFATGTRTNNSKELVSQLQGMSHEQLVELHHLLIILDLKSECEVIVSSGDVIKNSASTMSGLPLTPVVVDKSANNYSILTENLFEAMEKGNVARVPVMMGLTTLEALFYDLIIKIAFNFKPIFDMIPSLLTRNIENPKLKYEVGKKIRSHFIYSDSFAEATVKELYELVSSDMYIRPLSKTAFLLAKYVPVYYYVFAYEGHLGLNALQYLSGMVEKPVPGTGHVEELAYIFNSNMTPSFSDMNPKDLAFIKKITKLWTNFVKFGNPTPSIDPLLNNLTWPKISISEPPFIKNYVELGEQLTARHQIFAERDISFWEEIYKKYVKRPYLNY